MSGTALAERNEPFIMRQDSLGNQRKVWLSEFKKSCCPADTADSTAVAYMRACAALGAIPEVGDIQLAMMRGKPVLIIREQMYLKNLQRKFPGLVITEKSGIIGPDGKAKAMNAKPEPDDIGRHEFFANGQSLGVFEGVRREWEQSGSDAWKKQPNHMLLVRMRCHNAKRIAPLDVPPISSEVQVQLLDEGELDIEPEALSVVDEGEEVAPEPESVSPDAPEEGNEPEATPEPSVEEEAAPAEDLPAEEAEMSEEDLAAAITAHFKVIKGLGTQGRQALAFKGWWREVNAEREIPAKWQDMDVLDKVAFESYLAERQK
jgi:hypothetical protein